MFGNNIDTDGFQRESTPLQPVSPYGCAKVFAHNLCHNYRNAYNMFISCGILFNHESPRRGSNFVTSKVVKEALRIHICDTTELRIGNTSATRDWGHAKDYVKAMWLMLQHDEPDDFVCATGVSHSVQDLIDYVFSRLMLNKDEYVVVDPKFFRAEELKDLKGDSTKLRETLGWEPEYTFETMIDEMMAYWKRRLGNETGKSRIL
jgi:GDPmannose 4,6-dehydratase